MSTEVQSTSSHATHEIDPPTRGVGRACRVLLALQRDGTHNEKMRAAAIDKLTWRCGLKDLMTLGVIQRTGRGRYVVPTIPAPGRLHLTATDASVWTAMVSNEFAEHMAGIAPGDPGFISKLTDHRRDAVTASICKFVESGDLVQLMPPMAAKRRVWGEYIDMPKGKRGLGLYARAGAFGETRRGNFPVNPKCPSPATPVSIEQEKGQEGDLGFAGKFPLPEWLRAGWTVSGAYGADRTLAGRLRLCWAAYCRDVIERVREELNLDFDGVDALGNVVHEHVLNASIARKLTARFAEGLTMQDLLDRAAKTVAGHTPPDTSRLVPPDSPYLAGLLYAWGRTTEWSGSEEGAWSEMLELRDWLAERETDEAANVQVIADRGEARVAGYVSTEEGENDRELPSGVWALPDALVAAADDRAGRA